MRLLLALLVFSLPACADAPAAPPAPRVTAMSLYDIATNTLEGAPASLSQYAGKVALVVNVASKCGNTPQYAGLETAYATYKDRGLVILGFPSNEFGGQEPGTAEEIASFCKLTYGVTFPMFEKSVTAPGAAQSPVYSFLTAAQPAPKWNFAKYLVGKDGKVVSYYPAKTAPDDPALVAAIEAELAK